MALPNSNKVITLRCACGKHYRVHNPRGGFRTTCPECGSLLEVTEADLATAFAADGSIELHEDTVEAKEAIPLHFEELRPATKDARPGLAYGVAYSHEEALLMDAMGGRRAGTGPYGSALGYVSTESAPLARGFWADLLASFYFAGSARTMLDVLLTGLGCALFTVILSYIPLLLPLYLFRMAFVVVLPLVVIAMYVIRFFWSLVATTAMSDDGASWFHADWDWWDEAVKPTFWLFSISFLCSVPALAVLSFVPGTYPPKTMLVWGLLAAGWFFWPSAVMAVALGDNIRYVRPDVLVRCILGIGPAYVAALALVLLMFVGVGTYMRAGPSLANIPVIGQFIATLVTVWVFMYLGYITFRTIGLLGRHFRRRLPWGL